MAITLNSISPEIFNLNADEFNGVERQRAEIVTCGRMLMQEYAGKSGNDLRILEQRPSDFHSNFAPTGEKSYASVNRALQRKMMLYAASRSCRMTGETEPADYDAFLRAQRKFLSDKTFLRVLSGIITDIITPVLPATMSNALGWIAETVSVPMGKTYELSVMSNDVFMFEDDSWGASRSKPANRLYDTNVTINPRLRTAKATVKWYQLVGNDADLGRFFNSMSAGLYSKVLALAMKAFRVSIANTHYVPTNLRFTNTSANWVTAASRVSALAGGSYVNTIAVGHPSALTKALPAGVVNSSTVNLDAALAEALGLEWTRYGYIGQYMGTRLMPLDEAIVPGTQNTTITSLIPNNEIYLLPTSGYRPIYVGMEEGTPITTELTPNETADATIDIIVSASIDAVPVFASKMAVITI